MAIAVCAVKELKAEDRDTRYDAIAHTINFDIMIRKDSGRDSDFYSVIVSYLTRPILHKVIYLSAAILISSRSLKF